MTVKEIVIEYLKANGFDGLCTENCGCGIDDLICCDGPCYLCEPAYRRTVTANDTYLINDIGMSVGETVFTTEKPEVKQ